MLMNRVIPVLLLRNGGLVKTLKFKDPKYLGDPVNAVRIFNEKEVDELIFLDITASIEKRRPPISLIGEIASECFMPFAYGGGIRNLDDIKTILNLGAEKVVLNSFVAEEPTFVRKAADLTGSQSIIVSIDIKKNLLGKYEVFTYGGRRNTHRNPIEYAQEIEKMGAGEIFLNSIDRDGTMTGYDLALIQKISEAVSIPVVACGGASSVEDISNVVKEGNASAAAAGALFVFQGKHRAFLISYPNSKELKRAFI